MLLPQERECWLALAALPGIGARRFHALLKRFGTAQAAWLANEQEWDGVGGLTSKGWRKTLAARKPELITRLQERLALGDLYAVTLRDEIYPELLRHIPDPPPVLYVKGTLQPEDRDAIAIVGTRKASPYGEKVCREIANGLGRYGRTVISGLARGIDGVAHRGALAAGGRTIAVLASGVDKIYPPEHQGLALQIVAQGALVSEYPPGTPAEAGRFPARNRIISGLAQGVIVVEAAEKSGALITADQALEQGREVFAVPGPVTVRHSLGCHRLIQQGAKLVVSIEDILTEVPGSLAVAGQEPTMALSAQETRVLSKLHWEPKNTGELVQATGLPGAELAVVLTLLEMKGLIRQLPGGRFASA
ncbi:MAG: DNA-processing protein DprA [Heliobacteriaceae bacterium]|nr:DNA-processing protein DprA [Heliobacteriaceae bacterium]